MLPPSLINPRLPNPIAQSSIRSYLRSCTREWTRRQSKRLPVGLGIEQTLIGTLPKDPKLHPRMLLAGAIKAVTAAFPEVPIMKTAELASTMGAPDAPALFDVREASEFAVSRIPGSPPSHPRRSI